ncbi:ABC transporter ATP-binding protein [Arthrobacter sp. BB-1]|uniref:sulfate/molybdate ABC transporter ATP-binding protein n=1 Tax=unclassified Arthrobacter TaxID=235627 RepID=UPI0010D2D99A|nr:MULTISPECIES: ABC transporter ATP-binding protein [unclassified Arthrobacter]TNB69537.1 ABC transporter ATP-binding protein [Arthrobacter sp. BB-1]VII98065.1 Molybdenum ABC transporter ATP-binding protein ModC [Arthrobacter sp. DR-2P]
MTFSFQAAVAERGFDVAFSLGPAETVAVMGPNGAGKSTLFSIIAGLLRPDSGRAELDGRALFQVGDGRNQWVPPHLRGTALLAQEPLLFPHLTAVHNVAFGPRSAGTPKCPAKAKALQWLAEVEAADLAARRPAELSGGQAQRVAVARALAADPGLLLLDEPMAALDIHSAPLLRRLLKHVLADRPAIIITHDVLDALMLADRVVILGNGRIAEEGPTRQVLQRPRSAFGAGLAGLNFIPGTYAGDGVLAGRGQHIAGHSEDPIPPGQAAVAVFPPSSVSVFLTDAHGSPRNSFEVAITDLEPHGDFIRVRAGSLAADITPAASADLGLVPGLPVHFVVKATAVSVYPL